MKKLKVILAFNRRAPGFKRFIQNYCVFVPVILFFSGCGNSHNQGSSRPLVIFAAASLTNVMTELGEQYQKDSTVVLQFNYASSGTLARQIEHGAQADIFLSANTDWVQYLEKKDLLETDNVRDLVGNELVIVSSNSDTVILYNKNPGLLHAASHIAIGDPGYVPAGKYAKEALENLSIFQLLKDKLVMAKDVRNALMLVELGEAEFGIVYRTDALSSTKMHIVGVLPKTSYSTIIYRGAICRDASNEADGFFNFLLSDEAQSVWKKYGFDPIGR